MKRIVLVVTVIAMLVALCACGVMPIQNQEEDATTTTTAKKAEVALKQYTLTMYKGDTFEMTAYAEENATLKWSSSDDKVALVNSKGIITAVSAGVVNITCTDGNTEATCTVTVEEALATTKKTTTKKTTAADSVITDYGQLYPHSSEAYLTAQEIEATIWTFHLPTPTGSYVQDAINEIYARNGYVFQTEAIQEYYEAMFWYEADPDFDMDDLNKYEVANIDLLKQFK